MIFKFTVRSSPKAYYFIDPDTKFRFDGTNMEDLIKKVEGYRLQNNLPKIDYLDTVIENYLCQRPENMGGCKPQKLKRGLIQWVRGGVALIKSIVMNQVATQEVADARSAICKDCKLNTFPDTGPFVQWSNDIAEQAVGNRKSSCHDSLGICDGCQCPLRAKVWYAGKIKLSKDEYDLIKKTKPNCWQLDENQERLRP